MQAKDIMTKDVITMNPDTTVFGAIDLLVNNEISGAPVVGNGDKVVGIVTEKDLLVTLDFLGEKNSTSALVKEFMTKKVISFSEDTPIRTIMQELLRRNIKRSPIIKNEKVIGIVSRRDILKFVRENDGKL